MGLDMTLSASRYVSNFMDTGLYNEVMQFSKDKLLSAPLPKYNDMPSITIRFAVMYWRKANHIHEWFVYNLAGGVDNCQEIYVSAEDLEGLLDCCEVVLQAKQDFDDGKIDATTLEETCQERLPTTPGFFFGSTDFDEGYWYDTQRTRDGIKEILEWVEKEHNNSSDPAIWEFFYRASW